MTLRIRLMVIIGLSCTILWGVTSVWLFLGVRTEFRDTLDERLAASARMVGGLVSQLPAKAGTPSTEARSVFEATTKEGHTSKVRYLHGELMTRTQNSPAKLSETTTRNSTRTIQGERWRSYT